MTAAEITRLHELYRAAGNVARDESQSEEARDQALVDVVALREQLDSALIEARREREVDEARAGLEVMTAGPVANPMVQAMREWAAPPTQDGPKSRAIEIPLTRANEEWFKDTGQSVKAGYTYTSELMSNLIFHENAESGVLAAGPTYIDTAHGRTLLWPMLATDATAAQTAERSPATLTYPVFSQPQLDAYRQDGYMLLTEELIRDSELNVWMAVTEVASRALATKVASQVAAGTGATMPDGLPIKAASGKTAASQTVILADELIDLYLSTMPGVRMRGKWICGSVAFAQVFKMKDGEGRYLFNPAVAAGVPDTIVGKPLFEDAAYPACTNALKPVTFGDVSSYYVRRIGGVRIERDDSVAFTSFETTVRFALYMDADLFDTSRVKALTMA
jgi:HK97 family phage major capsid protein